MKLKDAVFVLESTFSMKLAEDFDNVGLLCGNPERDLTGILIAHDALQSVVDEAIVQDLNLVVCFHPIIFSGLKSLTGKNYVERAVLKAIENKIAIYAIHTAFDNDQLGVNFGICEALGLKNQRILMPKQAMLNQLTTYVPTTHSAQVKEALFAAGAGSIGDYDECSFTLQGSGTFRPVGNARPFSGELNVREQAEEDMISVIFESFKLNAILAALRSAHPYEEIAYQVYALENENQHAGLGRYGDLETEMDETEFLQMVKQTFNLSVIRHSAMQGKKVRRVGVLGGSGASGIGAARAVQCDAYLTGDVKYHDFFQAEEKMLICDIGHYESEQFVVPQLFELLSEKFRKFAVSKSVEKTNPVNYFL